jgi:hypothetical protein
LKTLTCSALRGCAELVLMFSFLIPFQYQAVEVVTLLVWELSVVSYNRHGTLGKSQFASHSVRLFWGRNCGKGLEGGFGPREPRGAYLAPGCQDIFAQRTRQATGATLVASGFRPRGQHYADGSRPRGHTHPTSGSRGPRKVTTGGQVTLTLWDQPCCTVPALGPHGRF